MPAVENKELMGKLNEIGEHAARNTGIEIAEIQLRGAGKSRLLRVYIDKPGGVTHNDCEFISQRMSQLLDEQDAMPEESYTLEVSSLGLDRKLSSPSDFGRVVGQKVSLTVREAPEGSTHFEGRLLHVDGNKLRIELRNGEIREVPLESLQKAKLKFEL
ncbi:MAG: ribosome maturation factor RimP [Acidobacteriaceae bacterium]|nr:ribosome maturation factor RimP [Acidobacteriaceae bacterium]MBV9307258.1 ribosome maturation factor RimP [Acidobacteriaceae bacterium]